MQSAVEYFAKPPLISSACIRARLAARICCSVMFWAIAEVAKTRAIAEMLKKEDSERIMRGMIVFDYYSKLVALQDAHKECAP